MTDVAPFPTDRIVAVLGGTGPQGRGLARRFAQAGIPVVIGSRSAERAAETGRHLLSALGSLARHPWVGDVRGKGLLAGIELVRDRKTKEIMPAPQMQALVDYCLARGVIVGRSSGGRALGNTIVLAPPLVLTTREVDRIASVLDEGIGEIGRSLSAA